MKLTRYPFDGKLWFAQSLAKHLGIGVDAFHNRWARGVRGEALRLRLRKREHIAMSPARPP